MMFYKGILVLIFGFIGMTVFGQNYWIDSTYLLSGKIVGSDTLPNFDMKEVKVFPKKVFKNRRHFRRYTRLERNVKKAYPFALIARDELAILHDSLIYYTEDKDRRKFIRRYEKEMFRKYEADLRKLSMSQGRVLIKLVYREIGDTSYELVKEYRGSFSAVFWQGIARLFGSNLKNTYDPNGEDAEIEEIVQKIKVGLI